MSDIGAISVDEISDDNFNDVITLGRLSSFKNPMKWQFPDTTNCPQCGISFSSRDITLIHFRNTHADTSMICVVCNMLFSDAAQLLYHHAIQHPNNLPPALKMSNAITEGGKNVVEAKNSDVNEDQEEVDDDDDDSSTITEAVEPQKSDGDGDQEKEEVDTGDDDDDDDEDDLITLLGCGKTTHWRFPKGLKYCPVNSCRIQFGVRSDVITHYRKRHAKCSILCPICVKPICTKGLYELASHYRKRHPNKELPYDIVYKSRAKVEQKLKKSDNKRNGSEIQRKNNEDVDDLIVLKGLDECSVWQFPQHINHCPVLGCRLTFATRSHAIAHYKEKHAESFMLCSICIKPISTRQSRGVESHYQTMHPDAELPSCIKNSAKRPIQKNLAVKREKGKKSTVENCNSPLDQSGDDLIRLSDGGIWRFPKGLKCCPWDHVCFSKFETRQQAISHFRRLHADRAVFCSLCEKPIGTKNYRTHCKKMHPNGKVPITYKASPTTTVPCEICGIQLRNVQNMKKHIREVHSSERLLCPMKGCEYVAKRTNTMREHWQKRHSHLQFPEIRKSSNFTYKIYRPRNIKQETKTTSNPPVPTVTSDRQETPTRPEDNDPDDLLVPLRTASEPSASEEETKRCPDCNYVSKTVFALKMHRHSNHNVVKIRRKKRITPRSNHYDTYSDTDDEEVKKEVKKRRLVKKRARNIGNHDRTQYDTSDLEQSEDLDEPLKQPEPKDTLMSVFTMPMIFAQADVEKDPLEIPTEPLDLSMPKIFYVPDSEEEDVKPTITSQYNPD